MGSFGRILASGVAGAANSVGMMADEQIKLNNAQIIADRNLDMRMRELAMKEEMEVRAAARERARIGKYATDEVEVETKNKTTGTVDVPDGMVGEVGEGLDDTETTTKSRRKRTIQEIRQAMLEGGESSRDMQAISGMVERDEDRKSRERIATSRDETRRDIADENNATRLALKFDENGNPYATGKGKGADMFNTVHKGLREKREDYSKQILKIDDAISKIDADKYKSPTEKAADKAEKLRAKEALQAAWRQADDEMKEFERLNGIDRARGMATAPDAGTKPTFAGNLDQFIRR